MMGYKLSLAVAASVVMISSASAESLKSSVTVPDATKQLKKDQIDAPKTYKMPANCVSSDKMSIERGKFFFHNLSGKTAKKHKKYAKSLGIDIKDSRKELMKPYGGWKPYGNCVACHNTPGAVGAGNIGPDLTNYKQFFVDSGVRTNEWLYQKIADPRIDNPTTHMPIGLTTGRLFNEKEVCDIVSYINSI
ncbi:MAG: sulfur oxidation c-type cytochrome SoxX [Campylobacterota bacterium]|nr:sulfur oxidation c-type cytochrome SoxX [Campylobacterota bacterium]